MSNQSTVQMDCCEGVLSEQNNVIECAQCGSRTCPLHTYIDNLGMARCYSCFSIVNEFHPYTLIHYNGNAPNPINPKNTILVVFHGLHICGAARHCLELLKVMNEARCKTIMLALFGGGHWGTEFLERTNHLILNCNPKMKIDELKEYIDVESISIISAHYDPSIRWSVDNLPQKDSFYSHFHTEPEFGEFTNSTLRCAIRKCKKVFFPSQATRLTYSSIAGINEDNWLKKTEIIPNAIPNDIIITTKADSSTDKFHSELRIGMVTRLDPEKFSIELFLETLKHLRRIRSELSVKVVGGGIISDQIISTTRTSKVGKCVQFLGWQRKVEHLYEWADVTFLPSISETMPYAAIESIAFGKPTIIPKFGYFSQDRIPSELVFTYEPGNAEQAATLIIKAEQSKVGTQNNGRKIFNYHEWKRSTLKKYGVIESVSTSGKSV